MDFSTACSALKALRNHFFCFHQQKKSPQFVKFRQASNHCKKVLKAAKLAYANKSKESITSQKLGSCNIWQMTYSNLNKCKSAMPPLFSDFDLLICYLLHLVRLSCLLKSILI